MSPRAGAGGLIQSNTCMKRLLPRHNNATVFTICIPCRVLIQPSKPKHSVVCRHEKGKRKALCRPFTGHSTKVRNQGQWTIRKPHHAFTKQKWQKQSLARKLGAEKNMAAIVLSKSWPLDTNVGDTKMRFSAPTSKKTCESNLFNSP